MEPKFKIVKDPKGVEHLYGVFRPEGMEYGKDGIRKKLCTVENSVYKQTAKGRRARSEQEYNNYVHKLYYEKLREILLQKKKKRDLTETLRMKEGFEMFLKEKEQEGESTEYTLRAYARAFTFYIKALGNHHLSRYKKGFQSKLIGALREKETIHKDGKVLKRGLDPETINTYIAKYNTFFAWAFDNEFASRPHRIKRVKVERKIKRAHSTDRQLRIENAIFKELQSANLRSRTGILNVYRAYMVISETGLRLAEVWSLTLNRINLSTRRLEIRSVPEIGYRIKEGVEKSPAISDFLYQFLKHDVGSRGEKEVWFLDNGEGSLHFTVKADVTRMMTAILKRNDLYDPSIKPFHGFRSRVTTIVGMKKGMKYAQIQVGHQDPRTTEGYFADGFIDMDEVANIIRDPDLPAVPRLPDFGSKSAKDSQ